MAIGKLTSALGGQIEANYWRITDLQMSVSGETKRIKVRLQLFLNRSKALISAPDLDTKFYVISLTDAEALGDLRAISYNYIMENDSFFSDAETV
jgi:hypothetical protein